jgi:hypothetical protein
VVSDAKCIERRACAGDASRGAMHRVLAGSEVRRQPHNRIERLVGLKGINSLLVRVGESVDERVVGPRNRLRGHDMFLP